MAVFLLCILVVSHVTLVHLFATVLKLLSTIPVKRLFSVGWSKPSAMSWSNIFSRSTEEKHSLVWCVGPSDTGALQSRIMHDPHEDIFGSHSGKLQETGGGWRQRSCLVVNACLRDSEDAVILHLNRTEENDVFMKVGSDVGKSGELFKLRSQKQWESGHIDANAAHPFNVRYDPIPTRAIWHDSKPYVYYKPFFPDNFGHCIFDDMFAAFAASRTLGVLQTASAEFNLMPTSDCSDLGLRERCERYLYDWGKLFATEIETRASLGPGLHCFEKLVVGIGMYSPMGLDLQNVGRATLFREFHERAYNLLGLDVQHRTPHQQKVLIIDKKGRRRVTNSELLSKYVTDTFGVECQTLSSHLLHAPASEQIKSLQGFTVILTPVGGISMPLFFSQRGTAVVFISHINWEDLFFNNANHIIDLYYICSDEEVIHHDKVANQWNDASITPDLDKLGEVIKRAMIQHEKYMSTFA